MLILSSLWEAICDTSFMIGGILLLILTVIGPPVLSIYIVKSLIAPDQILFQLVICMILMVAMWTIPIRTIAIYQERKNVRNS